MRWTWMAVGLVGCGGYGAADFIPAKTEAFCNVYLECADEALITFEGLTLDRCISTYGPVFQDEQAVCKLRKSAAKRCVTDIQVMSCPTEGGSTPEEIIAAFSANCINAEKNCVDFVDIPTETDATTEDTGS